MIQYESLDDVKREGFPVALTIGNFDGVHTGHQVVLRRLMQAAKESGQKCVVITFTNHPGEILRKDFIPQHLCTMAHKMLLMEKSGIDILIAIPFTKELSQQSAEEFLRSVYSVIPFSRIILGHDASFGKNKDGDREKVKEVAADLGSEAEYLEPFMLSNTVVSSTVIRSLILKGDLKEASRFLGRPYSIYSKVKAVKNGNAMIDTNKLCLPPPGIYSVCVNGQRVNATIAQGQLLVEGEPLLGQFVEVLF